MSNARLLLPGVRPLLTEDFRMGVTHPDLSEYLRPLDIRRDLPIEVIRGLLDHAMKKFDSDRVASDRWLAPRFHAALRLRREEAAERGLWRWLGVDQFHYFVRWRFPAVPLKRFVGGDRDHALARLWWGAELFRNGSDYEPAELAFVMQDVPSTWLTLNAVHHRAAAQAALTFLPAMTSDTINDLATALDHVLMTIQLDVVAPIDPPDALAVEEWIAETPDLEDLLEASLPKGPNEDPVSESDIEAVKGLIVHVAAEIGLPLPEPVR